MTCALMLLAALLPVVSIPLMGYYDDDVQWLINDCVTMLCLIFISWANFLATSYKNVTLKALSLLVLFTSMWWLADYLLLEFYTSVTIRHINDIVFLLTAFPMALNILVRPYKSSVDYRPKGTFAVYKRPRNFLGLVAALITSPYGSRSFVRDGVEYKFHNGTLISRRYMRGSDHHYIEFDDINLEEHLGKQWRFYDNCFNFYEKLGGGEKRRDNGGQASASRIY